MICTRFAPSPTGSMHIGSLRTAAYSYALAKHSAGQFLLRIEDTDQKREVKGATDKIFQILEQFGIIWDGTPVIQSTRASQGAYRQAALKLVSSGHAFYCQCQGRNAKTQGYSTTLRDPCRDQNLTSGAIKLRVPDDEKISFFDFVIKKEITWNSSDVSDTVLLKSDGQLPTYHLAVAVDDHDSQVTHVIRAVEWLPSTPIHILVHRFLGYGLPQIGHPSDILDPAGGKLSKRKGNVSCEQLLDAGYLPEALLNFVILLGWAPKDNRELFTLQEFTHAFDENGFQKSNPVFNQKKLDWFNGHYIRQKSDSQLQSLLKPFLPQITLPITSLVKDRIITLVQAKDLTGFFFIRPKPSPVNIDHIHAAIKALDSSDWSKNAIDHSLLAICDQHGYPHSEFFMSLRLAICGSRITPPLTDSMLILGKQEVISRLNPN